jgi:hypothetical protein
MVSEKTGMRVADKSYFSNPCVNEGFYSLKRKGIADVDPKVSDFEFYNFGF